MDTLSDVAVAYPSKSHQLIFDCDVHPVPKAGLTSLAPYLPRAWQERFARKQAIHDGLSVPIRFKHPNGSVVRQDARTPEGLPPASSPNFLLHDLLDTHAIDGVLLNCFEAGGLLSAQASTEESIVLAAAYNDLFIEECCPWIGASGTHRLCPRKTQQPQRRKSIASADTRKSRLSSYPWSMC